MEISLLCNAGLALHHNGSTLLIDAPNGDIPPFCALKDEMWHKILYKEKPFENIVGLYFTHCHGDHYSEEKVAAYQAANPTVPVFLPNEYTESGTIMMGDFCISYQKVPHAPLPEETPPHVVTKISAGDKTFYIAADAILDAERHAAFMGDKQIDVAFWNAMYLSRPETRALFQKAKKNYIYHMPENNPDAFGLWKKCQSNFKRYGDKLNNVIVMDRYPYTIEI